MAANLLTLFLLLDDGLELDRLRAAAAVAASAEQPRRPSIKPAAPAARPDPGKRRDTRATAGAAWVHDHQCPRCGTRWTHPDNSPNADHRCPGCGRMVFEQVPGSRRPAAPPRQGKPPYP